jgi:hypothetical protein
MGDHGFRNTTDSSNLFNYFQNQNAIFFPDKDYASLPDNICTVNEFRIVLDKLFHAGFPLLKDTTIFLKDKK